MKKYTFAADSLTVCGPHFPEGKSFPVRYELQDRDEMKRGQILPIIHAFATLEDGKEIKIDIPGDDEYYNDAATAMDDAEKAGCSASTEPDAADPVEAVEEPDAADPVEAVEEPDAADPVEPVEDAPEPAAEPSAEPAADTVEAVEEPNAADTVEAVEEPDAADPVEAAEEPQEPAKERTIPEKTFIGTAITGRGYAIIFDKATERTRVILSDPTNRKARAAIKEAGFYYSPSAKSWNRKLTFRAYRAANALAAQLDKIIAA